SCKQEPPCPWRRSPCVPASPTRASSPATSSASWLPYPPGRNRAGGSTKTIADQCCAMKWLGRSDAVGGPWGVFRPELLTRLFATVSRTRDQGQHSRPHGRRTRSLQARLTVPGNRINGVNPRENRGKTAAF